jgi:hypothetical protein
MRTVLSVIFGILLIVFTTFDDNSVRYSTCENTSIVRYDVVENFSKNKKTNFRRSTL